MRHVYRLLLPLGISFPALFAMSFARPVLAQGVPGTFTYEGYVTDSTGKPLPDGSNAMQFRLYSAGSDGSPLWDSGAMNVGVRKGIFAVVLGASPTPPLSSATLSSADIWVEVKVGSEILSPRTKLTSAPFAMRAADLVLPFAKTVSSPTTPVFNVTNSGANYGIRGVASSPSFAGLLGENTGSGMGVYGTSESGSAVRGWQHGSGNVGVLADSQSGLFGTSTLGYGVWGTSTQGHAGYFTGNVAIPSPGRLGIGLDNPTHPLYVLQNGGGYIRPLKLDNPNSTLNGAGVGIHFSVGGDGANNPAINRGKGSLMYWLTDTWNRGDFHFLQDSGADELGPDLNDAALTIKNNGRIGIGTRTPGTKLEVADLVRVQGSSWPGSGEGLELAYSPTLNKGYVQAYDRTAGTWGDLYLGDGKVGIGVSAPTAKLDLGGDLRVTGAITGNMGTSGTGAPFPRPAYDSGWLQLNANETKILVHNVGGDPSNYFVYMVRRDDSSGTGINNIRVGGDTWGEGDNGNPKYWWGTTWWYMTANDVKVQNWSREYSTEIRLRIWVIK